MASIIKALPNPCNYDLIFEELRASYPQVSIRSALGQAEIYNVTDDQATNDAIDAIIAAHDANGLTSEQQLTEAAQIAVLQGKAYLRKQMLQASPNVTTIYNTLKTQVDNNAYLLQMVNNQIAINSNAYVWTLNLISPTALDRQRYIKCVQEVIALLT